MNTEFLQNACRPLNNISGKLMLIRMNFHHRRLAKWGFSFLPLSNEENILDIGCGGGKNISTMLKAAPLTKIYGIDYSSTSVSYSKYKNRKEVKSGRAIISEGNVTEMSFGENQFDVITAFETIYFWQPIDKALNEVYRILKPNGRFMITCELNDPLKSTELTKRIIGMTIYSPSEMEILLKNIGFQDVETHIDNDYMCLIGIK